MPWEALHFTSKALPFEKTTIRMEENNIKWNTDKELMSKIYKQLKQLNTRKTNKWGKDLNRYFSREDIEMANEHIQRCLRSLIIREVTIEPKMRYHLNLVRMAIIKNSTNNKCWKKEKMEPYCTVCGNVNRYSHCRRRYGDSLEKLGLKSPYDLAIPLLSIYPEKTKTEKRHMYPSVHCSTVYNSCNMEET